LPRYDRVPPGKDKKKRGAGSPERLLAPTLADVIKDATGGKGRVVSLSLKDRGSVLPGGRKPDAVYWYDDADGQFVTSTYYRDQVHPWVAAFNERRQVDGWFGRDWTLLRSDIDYAGRSSPDDSPGEGGGKKQGRTFPHPMTGGLTAPGKDYYSALYTSPFGNDLLLAFTKHAVEAEQLGQRDTPDLLLVSFSANDPVGHAWGPDSQEVLDITLRTDLLLRDLLTFLDQRVGKGNYVLALSADHGVCPLPERSQALGKEAGRLGSALVLKMQAHLQEALGRGTDDKARWIDYAGGESIYLNHRLLREREIPVEKAERAVADWLKTQTGVQTAYTRTDLLRGVADDDEIGRRVRRSFHPERSGDVFPVLKPYYIFSPAYLTGTTHGSPHAYDTHVPLIVFGAGVRPGVRTDSVTPLAAPVILARSLGLSLARSTERVPAGLFHD
jgi:predicted AlkP superfamily pyrophosphatase or phosphodiesterase